MIKPYAQLAKEGGHAAILHTILCNYTILATQRGEAWSNGPPKYAPGQVRFLMFQASKKAPPLRNPGYATAQDSGKLQLSNTLRVGPWKISK